MLIVPAIDLLHGQPVRLYQGDFERVTAFGPDPVALARAYAASGAPWLHLVDLDGARTGRWCNLDVIGEIAAAVPVPVQAGGGARQMRDVDEALDRGVARVLVGTAAIESPEAFAAWTARFGVRLAVSLDTRNGMAAVKGWTAESSVDIETLARALKAAGVARFIHTDVRRDGTLGGVDLAGLRQLLPLGLPVMVAGGIGSLEGGRQLACRDRARRLLPRAGLGDDRDRAGRRGRRSLAGAPRGHVRP